MTRVTRVTREAAGHHGGHSKTANGAAQSNYNDKSFVSMNSCPWNGTRTQSR